MTTLKTRNISLSDPVAILNRDLTENHSGMKSASTFPTTATRTFNISLQFDSSSPSSSNPSSRIILDVNGVNNNNKDSSSSSGIPCRFKSVIELGPVEQLASAPVESWRRSQFKTTWTAEEDLAILKAASALVAWESYRGARSAFPGSLEDADMAFPKPTETEEDKELFVERWHALNEAENFERKRLLSFLQNSRALADDTQVKNDDDLLERIRNGLVSSTNPFATSGDNSHLASALTAVPSQKSCALHKAVTRKIKQIRAIINNSSDGEPLDLTGMHSHAPPNKTLVGAMSPDMVVIAKSAPTSLLELKKLEQEMKYSLNNNGNKSKLVGLTIGGSDSDINNVETENNNNTTTSEDSSQQKQQQFAELGAKIAELKCASTSVLPNSNLLKHMNAFNVANQKSQEAALRAKRLREKEEREAAAEIESIKNGTNYLDVLNRLEQEQLEQEGITLEELRAQEVAGLEEHELPASYQHQQQQHDDLSGGVDLSTNNNNEKQNAPPPATKPKYPPLSLSEYDDQFGLTPGKDSFGVFSRENLERFFNFCEDSNAVDLCTEAEQEYRAVRDAVERYSIRSSEAKILHDRRTALKSLETTQLNAENELRNSFQKTFDDVVASLANVFESHMTTAVQALRDKITDEKERIESVFDMEEHAMMLARYKLGLAAYCPDSVANRKSFHQLEGRKGMLLGDYQKWGLSSVNNTNEDSDEKNSNNNEDPLEIITKLLLLTETLQCPQLSQTIVQEIAMSSHHFVEFYNRKELHEYPLISRETMKALVTTVPLSELIQAKQIENEKRQQDLDQTEAAKGPSLIIDGKDNHSSPAPPQSVFSQIADAELVARRKARQEQLEQMSTSELQDLLRRCKVTASRLKRKFREQIRKQKAHVLQQHQQSMAKNSSSGNNNKNNNKRRFGLQQHQPSAVSSITSKQQHTLLPAIMSIKRKDVIESLLEDDDDQEYDDEILSGVELARDVNAGHIEALGGELTTDSDEEDEVRAMDTLVSRLLTSSRESDSARVRVAITHSINKKRTRRLKHVEDATHYIGLIEEVLSKRLFTTKGALLATTDASAEGISSATIEAVNEQNRKQIAAAVNASSSSSSSPNAPISTALKSSSLLLLTSSFRRGNRWRIHNKVSAQDTALAVNESGTSTVLTALKPLRPFTFFAMFPNEATLRRRCGTTTGKVFFQVRILNGPGPGNQTRLIGVGFDTSAHSRKVPMLNHDPLNPPVYKRDPKTGAMVVVNDERTLRREKNSKYYLNQYDITGQRMKEAVGPFKTRWGLTSNTEDMCMAILNKLSSKKSKKKNNNNHNDEYFGDEDDADNEERNTNKNNNSDMVFLMNSSSDSGATAADDVGSADDTSSTKTMNDVSFIPGSTPAPHPTESSLAAELRRSAITSKKRVNRGGLENTTMSNYDDEDRNVENDFASSSSFNNNDNDPLSSPFETFEDESRVAPDRSDHGFLWLSNGTILLHGSTYALGRDGTFVVGDTLHIALDEAEGTVLLFRNGQQVASPTFIPCPPVELLTRQAKIGGLGTRSSITNMFAPQLPQRHETKPVLSRSFWGVGPLIPCVTLLDSSPDHTVEGRAGKIGYLQNDLFAIQHKTFRKANMGSVDHHLVEEEENNNNNNTASSSSSPAPNQQQQQQQSNAPPPTSTSNAAANAVVDGGAVSDLDLNRFSLPSVECNVEGPFEEDVLPEFLLKNNYVPFLKAQREL